MTKKFKPHYGNRRWVKRALNHRRENPLCVMCLEEGLIVAVEVVDHVVPHRGNYQMFWHGKLQSLCKSCHDGRKQQVDKRGFYTDIGVDGFPTDSKHPFWKAGT
jgi:5-methylcytosine-specific restriction endonuclease McrA